MRKSDSCTSRLFCPGLLLLLALVAAGGCAKYEYVLLKPAEFTRTLRPEQTTVELEPLEYRFNDLKLRLGVNVVNPTDAPITLVGERSYVVDPGGQSHPVRGQTIVPRSFIAFTIPPAVWAYDHGPHFGIGVGVGSYSDGAFYGGSIGHTFYDDHWNGDYYDVRNAWPWKEGEVEIRLVYEQEGELIEHAFVFLRRRID